MKVPSYEVMPVWEVRYSKHGWGCRVVAKDAISAREVADAYMKQVNRYRDFGKYPLPVPKVENTDMIPVEVH